MAGKKKAKKKAITADDALRVFITVHVTEACEGMPAAERAGLVESIAELFGSVLVDTVKSATVALTTEPEEEDDEEEYEDDEEDDEDFDDEEEEDEDE
jgi:hypothetical protein